MGLYFFKKGLYGNFVTLYTWSEIWIPVLNETWEKKTTMQKKENLIQKMEHYLTPKSEKMEKMTTTRKTEMTSSQMTKCLLLTTYTCGLISEI